MSRNKILEEGGGQDESNDGDGSNERQQVTLRIPMNILDDLDDYADQMGVSRNAAVISLIMKECQ